jgi:hypothetical protein
MEGKSKMQQVEAYDPAENARRLRLSKMIHAIRFWVDNFGRNKFDPSFFNVMEFKHNKGERLSDKQYSAIERIYNKWVRV